MRNWLFQKLVNLALRHNKRVLIVIGLITFIMMGISAGLKMNFSWTDLLPEDRPAVREYKKIQNEHNDYSMFIILIEGENNERMKAAADKVAETMRSKSEYFKSVDLKIPIEFFENHMLMTMKPKDAKRISKIYSNPDLITFLANYNEDLEKTYIGGEDDLQENENDIVFSLDAVSQALEKIDQYLGGNDGPALIEEISQYFTLGDGYYFSLDRTKLMILASCTSDLMDEADKWKAVTDEVEADFQPIINEFSDLKIELTGMMPVGRDEIESIGFYTYILFAVALIFIFILLIFSFRMVAAPVLILIPLMAAIIWDIGFITIAIGYINVFTATISIVLLGIGIDFAIHMISRYSEERSQKKPIEAALESSLKKSGGGILTGGLTTAIAFLTLLAAENIGIQEFGLTAGMGIIFALIAMFVILPSLLVYREARLEKKGRKVIPTKVEFRFLGKIGDVIVKHPLIVLSVFILISVFMYLKSDDIGWEYNMLKLEPRGLRSVELYESLPDDYGFSSALSFITVDSLDEAHRLTEQFKKKKAVGQVESLSEIIRSDEDQNKNREILISLRDDLSKTKFRRVSVSRARAGMLEQLKQLEANLIELGDMSVLGGQDRVDRKVTGILQSDEEGNPTALAVTRRLIAALEGGENDKRMSSLIVKFFPVMKDRLVKMTNAEKITEDIIPENILLKFKSTERDRYMINIFPKEDIYNKEPLDRFLTQVDPVADGVTGMPQLIIAMMDATVSDGKKTVTTALFVIVILLLLDFSSKPVFFRLIYVVTGAIGVILGLTGTIPLIYMFLFVIPLLVIDLKGIILALMAMVPIVAGLLWTLGIMGIIGMDYNYMNLMALPIILGIGIDDGVHLLHRYRESKTRNLPHILTWVGKAILLTTLTTMIGFGSIAFYTHVGMATMGIVLLIGVAACFITTMFILAPILHIWDRFIKNDRKEN